MCAVGCIKSNSIRFVDLCVVCFGSGYAILEEKDLPQDLVVAGAPYLGPPVDVGDEEAIMLT